MTVVGTEFAFDPAVLQTKAGETLTITFENKGKYPHNMIAPELNINSGYPTASGGSTTFTATVPSGTAAGNYTFWCSVPTHNDRGMVGTITVG